MTHDDRVLGDMFITRNFKTSDRKYYLANIGYHNINYFLCPYCDSCYYLKK